MKRKGNAGENRVAHELRRDGWIVGSLRESAEAGDLIGAKATAAYDLDREEWERLTDHPQVLIVEVKANRAGGPYANFRRPQRDALRVEAELAGARPVLAYAPPNQPTRWIGPDDWPAP